MGAPTAPRVLPGRDDPDRDAPTAFLLSAPRVADGRPTEHAEEVFTCYSCWYLAWVLHRRTGWPMLALCDSDPDRPGPIGWTHVALEHPDGDLLDVRGLRPAEEVYDEHVDYGEATQWDPDFVEVPAADFAARLGVDPAAVSAAFARATAEVADVLLAALEA